MNNPNPHSLGTLRIGFAGTPEFARDILARLLDAGANVVCVYTQPDRPKGRGRKLLPCPVKVSAQAANIEVRQPASLRQKSPAGKEALAALQASRLDVLVVAAYGLILPQVVLDAPTLGCVNVHASLLPRWRGAAPIERAIMAGDTESGVSIMRMEAGLDTGGVYQMRQTPISDTTTGRQLHDSLATLGAEALLATLDNFAPESWHAQNDTLATYADKLNTADALIDWHNSAEVIARQINALNDRLPARSNLASSTSGQSAETVKFMRATPLTTTADADSQTAPGTLAARNKKSIEIVTGAGRVVVHEVQLQRGKGTPMPVAAALNGYSELFTEGVRFFSAPAAPSPSSSAPSK